MPGAAMILELEIRYGFTNRCLWCAGRFLTSKETEWDAKAKNDLHDQGPRTDSLMSRIKIKLDHATLTCNLIRQPPHQSACGFISQQGFRSFRPITRVMFNLIA